MIFRLAIIGVVLALGSPASAACSGKFASMAKLAGGEPSVLMRNPAVKSAMKQVLGTAQKQLKKSLKVHGWVDLIDCQLVVEGNARHGGGVRNAVLSFSLYDGSLSVGLMDHGRVTVFSSHSSEKSFIYDYLPAYVRDWAYVAANGFRSRGSPPANVLFYRSK